MSSESDTKLEERKTFYGRGQLREQSFSRNGKLEGERKYWYENGRPREQSFYLRGKREGKCKWWYENGQIGEHGFWRNGEQEGENKGWYENGKLGAQTFYRNGELINYHFNQTKKKTFLRLKRYFGNHANLFDSIIILDLTKIVYP